MNVASLQNISTPSGVVNINPGYKAKEASAPSIEYPKEKLNLSKGQFNEALVRKYNSNGLQKGHNTYEGSVNDKCVYLRQTLNKKSLFSGTYSYSGTIGSEQVDITIDKNKVTGKIGDKNIDLSFDKGFFFLKPYSIIGKIGDKEINITKGADLEAAKGENDIITTIAALKGCKFNIDNQSFGSLSLSQQANNDQLMQAAMFQQQQQSIMQNQMMMQNQMTMQNQMIMQNQIMGMI